MKLSSIFIALSMCVNAELYNRIDENEFEEDQHAARRLAFQRIVGYEPRSQVTDIAALDMDQRLLEDELFLGRMRKAQVIYTQGGHSRSFASVKITHQGATYAKGTRVFGSTPLGGEVSGTLMEGVSWPSGNPIEKIVTVLYHTSDLQEKHVSCQVGGLYTLSAAYHDGCFNDTGVMVFVKENENIGTAARLNYTYDIRLDNNNDRTLQKLSIKAYQTMKKGYNGVDCEPCPFIPDFKKFEDYYGEAEYGNNWVTSAFNNASTDFPSGRGNADFSKYNYIAPIAEAVSKGSAYLIVLMEFIRALEDAITDCETRCDPTECNEAHYYSIDAAAALYAGSIEKEDGSGKGKFLYSLADRRCINFKTCGEFSNEKSGTSKVNLQVIRELQKAQLGLLQNQCNVARRAKETIVNYIKVPLIQSVLQFAYVRQYENPGFPSDSQQVEAEGATFTAAVLPWVHECNSNHAAELYEKMRVGSPANKVHFKRIKSMLESVYPCLGITCGDVGGLQSVDGYYPGAEPCSDGTVVTPQSAEQSPTTASREASKGGLVAGALIGSVCAVLLAMLYVQRERANKRKRESNKRASNIAAVAEIA